MVWRFHPPFDQILSPIDISSLPVIAREYLESYAYRSLDLGGNLFCPAITRGSLITAMTRIPKSDISFQSLADRSLAGTKLPVITAPSVASGRALVQKPIQTQLPEAKMTDVLPHRNLYTRLKISAHGIGVFAIKHIPNRLRLFEGDASTVVRVPRAAVDQIQDAEVRRMYFDFCPMHDGNFIAPVDFNQLTMAWYMNHSDNANVQIDATMQFIACRPIAAGEELTTDYTSFSDHAPALIAQWHITEKPRLLVKRPRISHKVLIDQAFLQSAGSYKVIA